MIFKTKDLLITVVPRWEPRAERDANGTCRPPSPTCCDTCWEPTNHETSDTRPTANIDFQDVREQLQALVQNIEAAEEDSDEKARRYWTRGKGSDE